MNYQKTLGALFFSLILSGCASYGPSLPAEYVGPKASVQDSVNIYDGTKSDFFYISHIDGREIQNSVMATRSLNYGGGMFMYPKVLTHEVPAKEISLTIVGRTEYAAPILAMTHAVYQVKGQVKFTPEENKKYVVKGALGENYSAVWIEEAETHSVVGKKIETNGSAKPGAFQN